MTLTHMLANSSVECAGRRTHILACATRTPDLFEQVDLIGLDTEHLTNKIKIRLKLSINVTIRSKLKKL